MFVINPIYRIILVEKTFASRKQMTLEYSDFLGGKGSPGVERMFTSRKQMTWSPDGQDERSV